MQLNSMAKAALFFVIFVVSVTTSANAAPLYYAGTGHYYDAIYEGPYSWITWDNANTMAQSMSHNGVQGYLATVTSQGENDFIINNLGGPHLLNNFWLGGFQPPNSQEPGGNWQWVTGETWSYTNWYGGEPNNTYGGECGVLPAGSPEDRLHFFWEVGEWNDFPGVIPMPGFIVEYDTKAPSVPEPGTIILLGIGLIVTVAWVRKLSQESL